MSTCEACAEAKAKQKRLPSRVETITKAPTGICTTVTKLQWVILVDEKTGMKWTEFQKHKNDMVEPMCSKFHKWKEIGLPVK
eukprot:7576375-Ditylum_brightwellii.AAC.1